MARRFEGQNSPLADADPKREPLTEGEIVTPTLLARRFTLGHAGGRSRKRRGVRNAAHPSLQAREPLGGHLS